MTHEKPTNEQEDGLVIYGKTDRKEVYEHTFPRPEDIEDASLSFPKLTEVDETKPNRHFVSLTPGSIKVSKKSKLSSPKSPNYKQRQQITEWSKKSRSNMVAVLCSLDYTPMFRDGGVPALITLTYPKTFKTLVPTAADATRHLKLFRQRYERAFGKIHAIYKWEFMRSGSPHVHLFFVPPSDPNFKTWLSETWAEIVSEPDPIEYQKHIKAGTAVDYGSGVKSSDPKRVAVYFSKHSSPNINGQKEYQNQPPAFWKEAGSVGRFWGRWGLRTAVYDVEISEKEALFVARTLRRWAKANNKPRKVSVWRVNTKTGVVYKRAVNRRVKRMKRTEGFCAVNDGSQMGKQLARAVRVHFVSSQE